MDASTRYLRYLSSGCKHVTSRKAGSALNAVASLICLLWRTSVYSAEFPPLPSPTIVSWRKDGQAHGQRWWCGPPCPAQSSDKDALNAIVLGEPDQSASRIQLSRKLDNGQATDPNLLEQESKIARRRHLH
ncbi:hypothetical protein LIA77_01457 [Sarocladium implicatum]|nr:hypothetical protein LIA77_01457 [Sarocladium implicatum]